MSDNREIPESLSQLLRHWLYKKFGFKVVVFFFGFLAGSPFVYPVIVEYVRHYSSRIDKTIEENRLFKLIWRINGLLILAVAAVILAFILYQFIADLTRSSNRNEPKKGWVELKKIVAEPA